MKMPFPPHQGRPIEELSTRYLKWVATSVSPDEWPELVAAVKEELKFRGEMKQELSITVFTVDGEQR